MLFRSGSFEDLFAFNEECVARAIFEAKTPIISAVGHEVDTTISDFVADQRASTPSAAAELAVYPFDEIKQQWERYEQLFYQYLQKKIQNSYRILKEYEKSLQIKNPKQRLLKNREDIRIRKEILDRYMQHSMQNNKHRLALYAERLHGKSPLEKLGQGYSYIQTKEQKTITSIEDVQIDTPIDIDRKSVV